MASVPIGKGGAGRVFVARDRTRNAPVAVKVVPRARQHSIDRECQALEALKAEPRVVNLHGVWNDAADAYLVLDLLEPTAYHASAMAVAEYVHEVLGILSALHETHGYVHGDVKPANFVQTIDGVFAIDFDNAFPFEDAAAPLAMPNIRGTPVYLAPECLKYQRLPASDVWAVGVMAHAMLLGKYPFAGGNEFDVGMQTLFRSIFRDEVRSDAFADPLAYDFCRCLLAKNPSDRPTAAEAMRHPWLENLLRVK